LHTYMDRRIPGNPPFSHATDHAMAIQSRKYPLPHVVLPHYVGLEVAREVVEEYYRSTPFGKFHVEWPGATENIVCRDLFEVGAIPAKVFQQLQLTVDIFVFDADHREVGKKEVSDLFAPLLKFVNKKGFKLEIELSQHPILLNFGRRISNHSNRSWKCSRLRVQMSRSIGLIIRTLARPMNLVIFLQTLSRASSTTRSDTANQIGNTA
jgi:hypothetical protein